MDVDKKLAIAYKNCKLLKIECIKEELDRQIKGYQLKKMETRNEGWTIYFENPNKDYITLSISFNTWQILKYTSCKIERLAMDEKMLLTNRIMEKRQNGVVYSIIKKQFAQSNRFQQIVLTDLEEQSYVITKEKMNILWKNIDFDNRSLIDLFLIIRTLERDLKSQSDFYSEFKTHMNYYFNLDGGRKYTNNIYPTKTYINGEDISSIYCVDGPDKLYRIYDLYRGIINPRNENDINAIHLGLLSQDAYNLKELKGIKDQEDSLVGESLGNVSNTYATYLKNLLEQKFGYKGNIDYDRDSILLGITYQIPAPERAKREIERKLEIPYSEYEQLDFEEQRKLIEQKTGKKFKYDKRLYRIHTKEEEIDTSIFNKPKTFLRRLLKKSNNT